MEFITLICTARLADPESRVYVSAITFANDMPSPCAEANKAAAPFLTDAPAITLTTRQQRPEVRERGFLRRIAGAMANLEVADDVGQKLAGGRRVQAPRRPLISFLTRQPTGG